MKKSTIFFIISFAMLGAVTAVWFLRDVWYMSIEAANMLLLGYVLGIVTHVLQFAGIVSAAHEHDLGYGDEEFDV